MRDTLDRFLTAQDPVYDQVLRELRNGKKLSHWMWFVFPQLAGLGRSEMARYYAIATRAEAAAYADHPVLGARLRECTSLVIDSSAQSLVDLLGTIDALKFHSSMTLFALTATEHEIFHRALDRFFDGRSDAATVALLDHAGAG